MQTQVTIDTQKRQVFHGIWDKSSDKTIHRDIPALSKGYYDLIGKRSGEILPFVVLSKDYDVTTGRFELFIGGTDENDRLESCVLPEGTYGRMVVRPKLGLLWGAAIGEAKRYFYTKWLPASGYEAVNLEFELHTEKSVGSGPEIDLLFAVREK